MTREEVINELKDNLNPYKPPASPKAISTAISLLEKENEPAPSEDNTGYENQKKYFRNNNDNTEKKKCQEEIAEAIENMLDIYNSMSPEEQNAWELGEANRRILDVQRMIEEDE